MFQETLRSNLSHFKEVWSSSAEFREIVRDLGLLPFELWPSWKYCDIVRRENDFCAAGRADIEFTSRYEIVEQLNLFPDA